MKVSLIITTYNWVEALNVTLNSVMMQTVLPEEIIIADDGSSQETTALIRDWQQKSLVPVVHSWQEDKGFRLAKSRNKAIAKAKCDYILLIDGDLFLHRDFIKGHLRHAKKGQFSVGTRVVLAEQESGEIMNNIENVQKCSFFSKGILKNRKNIICNDLVSDLFSFQTKSYQRVRGANMAFFRSDVVSVNGFNEEFVGWGREDTEIVVRLLNAGIARKNIKFNANVLHLYHKEVDRASLSGNDAILEKTIVEKLTRCEKGVDSYL